MKRRRAGLFGAAIAAAATIGATASAAGPPPPPTATNGGTVEQVAAGLMTPTSFAFGPGGAVFEGDGGASTAKVPNGGVYVLSGGTATKLAGSPPFVAGVLWHGSTLYVAGGGPTGPKSATFTLQAWSGWDGTKFASQKVIYTAPKDFEGFNGLGYAGGRLYVGVDTGLLNGNDHGPASLSPYLYDMLTIKPNGKGLKVFATGMRQPWQMVFPAGSTSPLVSDLGQDKAAKAPLDAVLRVKQGDNFGFPKCVLGSPGTCTGFAKPFQTFSPHTDIMGLAIVGKTLYMTSFLGSTGKGPGGEVLSMPLSGGTPKPVITGFVAPTVGLGESGGYLYVGELTGQVFRLKVG